MKRPDPKMILAWIKQHPLVPVFSGVVILALGLGWWFSGQVNSSVRMEAESQAAKIGRASCRERVSIRV